jgi:hypothetical protein
MARLAWIVRFVTIGEEEGSGEGLAPVRGGF